MNAKHTAITQLQKIILAEDAEVDCQQCLTQLSEYINTQLDGANYRATWPETAVHLDSCPNCAGAYARLYELELATANQTLPTLTHMPQPDLDFLTTAVVPQSDLLKKVATAVQTVGDKFVVALTTELMGLLRPLPNTAPVLRSSDTERYAEILFQLDPAEMPHSDLPFTITAFRDAQENDQCLVEIRVQPPDQSWPALAGKQVNLKLPTEIKAGVTDPWGLAIFEAVKITNLATATIEIAI